MPTAPIVVDISCRSLEVATTAAGVRFSRRECKCAILLQRIKCLTINLAPDPPEASCTVRHQPCSQTIIVQCTMFTVTSSDPFYIKAHCSLTVSIAKIEKAGHRVARIFRRRQRGHRRHLRRVFLPSCSAVAYPAGASHLGSDECQRGPRNRGPGCDLDAGAGPGHPDPGHHAPRPHDGCTAPDGPGGHRAQGKRHLI